MGDQDWCLRNGVRLAGEEREPGQRSSPPVWRLETWEKGGDRVAHKGFWLSAGLILWTACGTRSFEDPLQDPFPGEQVEVQRTLEEVLRAAEQGELERLESYHAYGPKFTKFAEVGFQRLDAEAARRTERQGLRSLRGVRLQAEELKVDVFGPVAVATFLMGYELTAEQGSVAGRLRASLVFVKAGPDWKIVHEHLSSAAPPP